MSFYRRVPFHPKTDQTTRTVPMNSKVRCATCKSYVLRDEALTVNSMTRVCSSECLSALYDRRRTPRAKKTRSVSNAAPKIPIAVRAYVHVRDGNSCRWCGAKGTQCHHVKYRSQGGTDTADNLILLCHHCHQTKAHGDDSRRYRQLFRAYIWLAEVEGVKLTGAEVEHRYGTLAA